MAIIDGLQGKLVAVLADLGEGHFAASQIFHRFNEMFPNDAGVLRQRHECIADYSPETYFANELIGYANLETSLLQATGQTEGIEEGPNGQVATYYVRRPRPRIDAELVGASISTASIMIALAVIFPTTEIIPFYFKMILAFPCLVAAALSSICALWWLARYCLQEGIIQQVVPARGTSSKIPLEIASLLASSHDPAWLLAMSIVLLFVILVLIDFLVVLAGFGG